MLLQNVECVGLTCDAPDRTFSPDWSSQVSDVINVTSGTFFDFSEDVSFGRIWSFLSGYHLCEFPSTCALPPMHL